MYVQFLVCNFHLKFKANFSFPKTPWSKRRYKKQWSYYLSWRITWKEMVSKRIVTKLYEDLRDLHGSIWDMCFKSPMRRRITCRRRTSLNWTDSRLYRSTPAIYWNWIPRLFRRLRQQTVVLAVMKVSFPERRSRSICKDITYWCVPCKAPVHFKNRCTLKIHWSLQDDIDEDTIGQVIRCEGGNERDPLAFEDNRDVLDLSHPRVCIICKTTSVTNQTSWICGNCVVVILD